MNSIALVDDHVLLRQGLASLIKTFPDYEVVFEADNGVDMINKLKHAKPSAILLDVHMPHKNGFESAAWLKKNRPEIKILALSMSDEEEIIIKMLQSGAHGYILKNTTPDELKNGLQTVLEKGYYLNEALGASVITSFTRTPKSENVYDPELFTAKELQFIRLSCTELTYNEIADEMIISPKTIDFYKAAIERKTGIKNRVSLALFALKNGIVNI